MSVQPAPTGSLSRERERVRVRARVLRKTPPEAERSLWLALRDRRLDGWKFRRQHPIAHFFADFACVEAKLVVELDGGQHYTDDGAAQDALRTAVIQRNGFVVLRFSNREVLVERDAVLATLSQWLARNHPHPNPLPLAGEGAKKEST